MGHGQGRPASSSRPDRREDTYRLQGGGHSVQLATNSTGRARTGNDAEISQKLSVARGKNTSKEKRIYLDTCRALSDGMEIG